MSDIVADDDDDDSKFWRRAWRFGKRFVKRRAAKKLAKYEKQEQTCEIRKLMGRRRRY